MAREIHVFHVTIPLSTPKSAPQVTSMTMPARRVDEVEIRVPPGPRGEVGFSLGSSGVAVIPIEAGTFIVTNDEVIRWPLEEFWDSGGWELHAYNTGSNPHTIEIRFLVSIIQPLAPGGQAAPLTSMPVDQSRIPSLPVPPLLPPLPGPPSLPPLPIPSTQAGPMPTLTVVEDDPMRYAELTRPDGTIDVLVLLNDGTIVHWTEKADTTPNTRDTLPGAWVAMRRPFIWQGEIVVRGLGTDSNVWQTTFKPGVDVVWSSPVKVLG